MTDFTEVIEVDGSDYPGAARRFTMGQKEFAGWWNEHHGGEINAGWDLMNEVLSANGEWVERGVWRFRRRIA